MPVFPSSRGLYGCEEGRNFTYDTCYSTVKLGNMFLSPVK